MENPHLAPLGVQPGTVLAGKYRVERVLGHGGMGVVVAAHHLQLDERVALKFLLPYAAGNPEAVARFTREARAAVKIKNEHVARVTDVGELENGAPYMVMEYLEGGDLAGWLRERGPMRVEQAVDFVLQTCEALADAHVLGIVHRDLKPSNLFCIRRSDGQLSVKVLDFGISKVTTPGAESHSLTRTTALMGSPYYMSPEQMQMSRSVDPRSDIWSLGVILFELVSGKPPFDADAVTELAIKIATEPAPPLRTLVPGVATGLERVIDRCLEKDRAKRFQNVGELAVALGDLGSPASRLSVERVLGTLRLAGVPSPAAAAPAASPVLPGPASPGTSSSWGQTGGGPTSNGKAVAGIAIAGLGLVAVAAVAGAVLLRRPPQATGLPAAAASATAAEAPVVVPSASLAPPPSASAPMASSPPAVSASPPAASASTPAAPAFQPGPAHRGGPPPAARTQASTSPTASPAPKANCNPPYVIDSAGYRQYKPECL